MKQHHDVAPMQGLTRQIPIWVFLKQKAALRFAGIAFSTADQPNRFIRPV